MTTPHVQPRTTATGGRFDFDDGGTYIGGWEDGKAHGHGVCTGPKGQGEYSGSWHFGFEVSGVYTWPSGSTFEGQWQNGKRHGLGVETRGRWVYRGEWTQGMKGRYGVRQSLSSGAKYEGTWANGLQDGYGTETYADGGIYQGQWLRGLRHGYGVRTSASFGVASLFRPKNLRASMTSIQSEHVDPASERDRKIDDCRGGFVLKIKSDEPPPRRRSLVEKSTSLKKSILQGLKLKKQRSTGDIDRKGVSGSVRSTKSATNSVSSGSVISAITRTSAHSDSNASFVSQDDITDSNVVETYMGELRNDKRSGFGISERSDGLKYEGEWYNNKKYGYGVTTFKDGTKEEGKYKNNVLLNSGKKKHLFQLRSSKFRERIDGAVNAATRASQIALQKADIAISRTATARGKAEQANVFAIHAKEDSDFARIVAKQFAPEFQQPVENELLKIKVDENRQNQEINTIRRPSTTVPNKQAQERTHSLYLHQGNVSQEYLALNPGENIHTEQVTSDALTMKIDRYDSSKSQVPFRENTPAKETYQVNQNLMNYLDPSVTPTGSEAFTRNPQGSFRHQKKPSFRERENKYTMHQVISENHDQYPLEHEKFKIRSRPSQSRNQFSIPKLQTVQAPLDTTHHPIRYTPDCTPDSGVSESMDSYDLSPGHVPRRSTLPNLHAESFQGQVDLGLFVSAPSDSERDSSAILTTPRLSEKEEKIFDSTPPRTTSFYGGVTKKQPPSQLQPSKPAVIKRKKSLPDIQAAVTKSKIMTRAEVSELSSQRREEVRRMQMEAERLRANPLLYFFNPDVKAWFSRQQLVILVLFVNISLAFMFFKLLT
ncbi:junctophilin-1-like [Limulus polyphemus]|uniref:Junctophilin-1-like n=1 Tax=Limulus polyphemus TaxID=6850 RepID=A0ABM1BVL9_LIMPO|nr:junctophilin-1-like [Limulus polyphemus]